MSRRRFLQLVGASAAAAACDPRRGASTGAAGGGIRAIAFDLLAIFDPRGVDARVAAIVPRAAPGFAATWKARLFEYSWLRAAAGQYVAFDQLVADALAYAAHAHRLELDGAARAELAAAFTQLEPWPDARAALRELDARSLRLALLTNFAPAMTDALLARADLGDVFEARISTHTARTYKPDPRAYALGEATLGLPRRQIAFAAFGAWDAAGARWYGYPSFWVNRVAAAGDELIAADATGPDLAALARWSALAPT